MEFQSLMGIVIQWGKVGLVIGIFSAIAIVLCILILIVAKVCKVETNEDIENIIQHLAGANCGGCGYSGCASFAKALVEKKCSLNDCKPTSQSEKKAIACIAGIEFVSESKTRAIVHCNGGINAPDKYNYVGVDDCFSKSMLQGGNKFCPEACLGEGSCAKVCPENAISMVDGVAVVDKNLCTSCGNCIITCPRNLIDRIPIEAKVYIACSTQCKGKEALKVCKVSCIGCGLCARSCPYGAITMDKNLAVIDYSKCTGCKVCVAKCPTKCIHEID